ncbi:hypothetical protein BaRGS_00039214 [Batillaria attramentaria]|uniref:Uncharacterized protein n=1 Tax=Batillaria attramentaria TaxID=370345 RepID=A0ABD0J3W1_9CAEN
MNLNFTAIQPPKVSSSTTHLSFPDSPRLGSWKVHRRWSPSWERKRPAHIDQRAFQQHCGTASQTEFTYNTLNVARTSTTQFLESARRIVTQLGEKHQLTSTTVNVDTVIRPPTAVLSRVTC